MAIETGERLVLCLDWDVRGDTGVLKDKSGSLLCFHSSCNRCWYTAPAVLWRLLFCLCILCAMCFLFIMYTYLMFCIYCSTLSVKYSGVFIIMLNISAFLMISFIKIACQSNIWPVLSGSTNRIVMFVKTNFRLWTIVWKFKVVYSGPDGWIDGYIHDRWMDGWIHYKWIDRWMDGWMDTW